MTAYQFLEKADDPNVQHQAKLDEMRIAAEEAEKGDKGIKPVRELGY